MSGQGIKGPFTLVTVNTAPERARRLVGRVVEALKDHYAIEHVDNCDDLNQVQPKLEALRPDVVFAASMWTPEQAQSIFATARAINPAVKTHAIPQGLQAEHGPDAVVAHLLQEVPKLLDHANSY